MQVNARWLSVLILGLAGWLSGCGQEDDGQYTSYSELSASDSVVTVESATEAPGDAGRTAESESAEAGETKADSPTNPATQPRAEDSSAVPATSEPASAVETAATGEPVVPVPGGDPEQTASTVEPGDAGQSSESKAEPVAREVRLLIPKKDFEVEGPDGALRVSYDDLDLLKVLNMDPVTVEAPGLLPDWLKSLSGKKVRVRGFMYPTFEETGLTRFILARDNQICCFGREAKVYDLIQVGLAAGETTNYIQGRPFDVVGTFRIEPEVFGEDLDRLYVIENAVLIDR